MPLFLMSFHERDCELGGCVVRARTEEAAIELVRRRKFGRQAGMSARGRMLITEMLPQIEKQVPERFVGRLLTNDEAGELFEQITPSASLPEPVIDRLADDLSARLDADFAGTQPSSESN